MTRLVCPHCGEYNAYICCAVTDTKALYWCEACNGFSEWKRTNPEGDWKSCEKEEE